VVGILYAKTKCVSTKSSCAPQSISAVAVIPSTITVCVVRTLLRSGMVKSGGGSGSGSGSCSGSGFG
jgi:hypothetical protein